MSSRHLCVFAKAPWPGVAKTRLVPPLSSSQAAALSRAMLTDVLAAARQVPDCARTLAYTPRGARGEMADLAGSGWRLRLQRGDHLGERLGYVLGELLSSGRQRVVVLGGDSPLVMPERVEEAFACLNEADVVLGPCEDGGFYLLGLCHWDPRLMTGVRWGTCHAFADFAANVSRCGLSLARVQSDLDVDDFQGLLTLAEVLRSMPSDFAPHTRAELARLGRSLGL